MKLMVSDRLTLQRVSLLWQDKRRLEEARQATWGSAMPPGYFDTVYQLESKPVAAVSN